MQKISWEYREWLITELDKNTNLDLQELQESDDSRLVALYQALGCLFPGCSHDARKAFTQTVTKFIDTNLTRVDHDNIYEFKI